MHAYYVEKAHTQEHRYITVNVDLNLNGELVFVYGEVSGRHFVYLALKKPDVVKKKIKPARIIKSLKRFAFLNEGMDF